MNRRSLLAALAAPLLWSPRLLAAESLDPWAAAFASARTRDKSLIGYDSAPLEGFRADSVAIQGRIPAEINGALLRNGPSHHQVGGARYHHWFDADGMVQRYRIADGKLSHLGRYVETPKFLEESAAGRMVEVAFGTVPPGARPITKPDALNVANINVITQGGRTMALWEGGSATEIDPVSLQTKGFVRWSAESAGLPFCAHPRFDSDGSLWNIGAMPGNENLFLYHIGADGVLATFDVLPIPADTGMIHDILATERHILIPLGSLTVDGERFRSGTASLLDSYSWHKDRPFRFLVVDKAERKIVQTVELPPGFVYHFGNAWEDNAGIVRVDASWYDDFSMSTETLRYFMRGERKPGHPGRLLMLTLDLKNGKGTLAGLGGYGEFPRFDERFVTRRSRVAFSMGRAKSAPGGVVEALNLVNRFDRESGRLNQFNYGPTVIADEHVFVPHPDGKEGKGWIIGSSLDWQAGQTRFAVFDAEHLSNGPLALGTLPYVVPLGLHGSWKSA